MIFIDASEGLAGDMLLAAMIGLIDEVDRGVFAERLMRAAAGEGTGIALLDVEDSDDRGLSIAYSRPESDAPVSGYAESMARLRRMEDILGDSGGTSAKILDLVFDAEATAHGVPRDEVHLHEVGRPEAMLNICGIGSAARLLRERGAGDFVCSTISIGGGVTVISHGVFRIPPPASAVLLRGLRHSSGNALGERATPTGIAAVKALIAAQSDEHPDEPKKRSVGFGTKRFSGRLGRTVLTWS